MLQTIKYKTKITINDIPPQWLSKIELYYPELPNFPLLYIHKFVNNKRMYGFPVAIISTETNCKKLLDITFEVLSNIDLEKDLDIKNEFKIDLEERIGASNKISKLDVQQMCNGDNDYISFFDKLWNSIEYVYGKYIPYGKFYEEVYSMVRFVAAFSPKTGKQSEMRMLYNFMSIFGEKVVISEDLGWGFCDFYLIPNYHDLKNGEFCDFPKFQKLFSAMKKVYNLSFTSSLEIGEPEPVLIKCQNLTFAQNKEVFIENTLNHWIDEGKISEEDKFYIERLTDAFNRFPWRTAFFISSIFIALQKPYETWDKAFFVDFYTKAKKGISPKVVACFIQQGFKNTSVIPIDTWVESFYQGALNIDDKTAFFDSFSEIGKLERVIWLSSQANKTNIQQFFNTLWCCRYGTNGNTELRGQNPLACYECCLRDVCKGYKNIKNKKVYVIEGDIDLDFLFETLREDVLFVCQTEGNIPKKIFKRNARRYCLVDEFSGYLLKDNKTEINNESVEIEQFLESIKPSYDTSNFNVLGNGVLEE